MPVDFRISVLFIAR